VQEERRRALVGYIYIPVRMNSFMDSVPFDSAGIKLMIYDAATVDPARLLYNSRPLASGAAGTEAEPLFRQSEQMNVYGRTWLVAASSLPAFEATQGIDRQRLVLASGIALSLALTAIAWLLSNLRARALGLAQAMTSQLRASEIRSRLLASLVEQSSDAMFSHDLDGVVTSWNEAAASLFGFSPEEALGKSVRQLHLAGVGDAEWDRVRQSFSNRKSETYEAQRRNRAGAVLDLLVATSPQYDDEGSHVGKIVSMRDITRRKRVENALRENRQQLTLALQGSNLALFDWDVRTGQVRLSELWNVILGGAPQPSAVTIGALEKLVHPEDLPVLQQRLKDTLKGVSPSYQVEHRVRTRGGGWKWISSTAKVTERDATGRALRVTGTNADISVRKNAEAALRESEERFQLAVSGSAAGIWDWDLAASEYYVSPQYEALLGFHGGEWRYSPEAFAERLHPEDRVRVLAAIDQHLRECVPYNEEYRMRRKNGSYGWFHDRGQALWDADGKPRRFSGSLDDITGRKETEHLKSDFIATVNHELRTPLTSVIGALDLLKVGAAGRLDGEAAMFLGMAQKNSERLATLVNDILDIEKLESGLMEFHRQPVALAPFLAQAVALNGPYAQQFGVELRLDPAPAASVLADEQRLMQVVTNLLSNAIKYSPRGDTVTLRAAVRESVRGRECRVSVQDHGPGIPMEFRSRIFGKFAQADSTDTRLKSGTGLGLAISKSMIEKMGGRIGFDSVPGQGATFYVDVPLA
jgi:PAS domain S-box-containing protein